MLLHKHLFDKTMADHFGLKWDPKNLEIRTMSVEKTLEPLVLQVTTLVNTKGPSKKKKGKSKRANALVSTVEKATENFIEKGEQIAYENPDITQEMLAAVEEVRKTGMHPFISVYHDDCLPFIFHKICR